MTEKTKFEMAIQGMQIPEQRRIGNADNAHWFLRDGAAINREHPMILLAICHARRLTH